MQISSVFVIIKMATEVKTSAKRDLNIWKLSLLYSRSLAVPRVVQKTLFTFVVREMSKTYVETRLVGKDKVHLEMDLFRCSRNKRLQVAYTLFEAAIFSRLPLSSQYFFSGFLFMLQYLGKYPVSMP